MVAPVAPGSPQTEPIDEFCKRSLESALQNLVEVLELHRDIFEGEAENYRRLSEMTLHLSDSRLREIIVSRAAEMDSNA